MMTGLGLTVRNSRPVNLCSLPVSAAQGVVWVAAVGLALIRFLPELVLLRVFSVLQNFPSATINELSVCG